MSRYDERFKAALTEDLKYTRKKGLGKVKRASIPALAELAEALSTTPKDAPPDDFAEIVEAALHRAISRVRADERATPENRRGAITDLFGIEDEEPPGVMRRRSDAASRLGRKSGEAVRKAEARLFSELAGHLLVLADARGFWYWPLLSYSTFRPDRQIYDYNSPSGRAGAMDGGPVFNSFINTPSYGDERTFFDARHSDKLPETTYDPVRDVTNGSKVIVLRIYVDNMAYVHPYDPYRTTAYGARVRVVLPTGTGKVLRARGRIWADNAEQVEDTVDLMGNEPFGLTYEPGSAVLLRGGREYALSDSIVRAGGALIGHSLMDGVLPAGNQFEYAAFVKLKVRVVPPSYHQPKPSPTVRFTLHETEGYEIITV